jgi:hypothetical protein
MRPALRLALATALAAPAAPAAAQVVVAPAPAYAAARDSLQTFAGWPRAVSRTSPAGGDTAGYWQQRADYRVTARLDERREVLEAHGTLTYVNRSPDTLRELFLHQHLNAFRPGSRWAAADAREGRVRFQTLAEPAFAFERFTRPPEVGGVAVAPEYPGGADSSVVRLALPRPLGPGDSVEVAMAWEARPSTIPRRQGRRGRSYDFAQWYPKVAVYDRGGWQPHALVPAGEFYGEFGAWDVTMILADDQVVGATGVPVEGDPGWARVSRTGPPRTGAAAYGAVGAPGGPAPGARFKLAAGERAVRWLARDAHHFGWSVSPDYRYEGAAYVRPPAPGAAPGAAPNGRARAWDTVGVHALYRPGDDSTWGGGRVTARTVAALRWLERVYGPYGYPQMTVLHRIETGGTEFPMVQMNGGPQQSLVLHEGGHIYSYGLLGNNEWQRGWMDEGLTSYQTSWAARASRHAVAAEAAGAPADPAAVPAAAPLDARRRAAEAFTRAQNLLARDGRAEPLNRRADLNATFGAYSAMVYSRGEQMYSALRDVLGAEAFDRFLRDYYARWAYRHVDDAAMRASAERAAGPDTPGGRDLGWFFAQWLGRVGTIDYAMRGVRTAPARGPAGCWRTEFTLVRAGGYAHPMPVGIRTGSGWTIVRGDPRRERQTLVRYTPARPFEVRLDPLGTTEAVSTAPYVWRPAYADSVSEPRPREFRTDLPAYATAAACAAAAAAPAR